MKIEVVEYDPRWSGIYETERLLLVEKLQKVIHKIHHIGSTSVENLAAKPVIDILIEVGSLAILNKEVASVEAIGYEALGEYGISDRRYFRKGVNHRTHQVHAFVSNDENVIRHIAFRNYLREHSSVMREYAQLKIALADACNNDIDAYCDGKEKFIKYHEAKAIEWSKIT